ncbi:MAG: hypothetical protein WAS23_07090, partial [Dokdonella sp.]
GTSARSRLLATLCEYANNASLSTVAGAGQSPRFNRCGNAHHARTADLVIERMLERIGQQLALQVERDEPGDASLTLHRGGSTTPGDDALWRCCRGDAHGARCVRGPAAIGRSRRPISNQACTATLPGESI